MHNLPIPIPKTNHLPSTIDKPEILPAHPSAPTQQHSRMVKRLPHREYAISTSPKKKQVKKMHAKTQAKDAGNSATSTKNILVHD
jgi:hypothetical protein